MRYYIEIRGLINNDDFYTSEEYVDYEECLERYHTMLNDSKHNINYYRGKCISLISCNLENEFTDVLEEFKVY